MTDAPNESELDLLKLILDNCPNDLVVNVAERQPGVFRFVLCNDHCWESEYRCSMGDDFTGMKFTFNVYHKGAPSTQLIDAFKERFRSVKADGLADVAQLAPRAEFVHITSEASLAPLLLPDSTRFLTIFHDDGSIPYPLGIRQHLNNLETLVLSEVEWECEGKDLLALLPKRTLRCLTMELCPFIKGEFDFDGFELQSFKCIDCPAITRVLNLKAACVVIDGPLIIGGSCHGEISAERITLGGDSVKIHAGAHMPNVKTLIFDDMRKKTDAEPFYFNVPPQVKCLGFRNISYDLIAVLHGDLEETWMVNSHHRIITNGHTIKKNH